MLWVLSTITLSEHVFAVSLLYFSRVSVWFLPVSTSFWALLLALTSFMRSANSC